LNAVFLRKRYPVNRGWNFHVSHNTFFSQLCACIFPSLCPGHWHWDLAAITGWEGIEVTLRLKRVSVWESGVEAQVHAVWVGSDVEIHPRVG